MIRLRNVSRAWPEFALRNISLEIETGEYLVIVGPTGAGKTLLLELLLGIHQPDEGAIFLGGRDVTVLPPEQRGMGMVYQDYLLFPHLDVEKNLGFGLRYRRNARQGIVPDVARLLGIEHLLHRLPSTLSGGEKQRVAIGRALATEPRILLLDEPFSALDRGTARRLREELRQLHQAQKLTIIHVTHDLAEARQMGSRIAVIHEGAIHAIGTAESIVRRPPTVFAATFFGAPNVFEARIEGDRISAGPISAPAPESGNGRLHLMVYPDEAVLLPGDAAAGQNFLAGEIHGFVDEGTHMAVQIRVPGLPSPLTIYASRASLRGHMAEPGACVIADVRHAIHVVGE